MFSLRALSSVVLAAAGSVAGCKSDRPSTDSQTSSAATADAPNAAPASVTVKAKDFAFDAPAQIPAGTVTMQLENDGKELHQVQLVKLEDGRTVQDLAAALKTHGPPPAWMKFVGGPNGVAPGQQSNATSVLAPGQYVYICLIPSPDGVIHAAKGMVQPFEVTATPSGAATSLPETDVTIKLVDFDFQSSKPLTPGRQRIMVENAGPQAHEVVLVKLAPGKTIEDFATWAMSMKGAPPAMPVGGVGVLENGMRASFTADLTAGDYGLICFVPDAKDGKLHLAHGMMKTIKVG
jgi:plastocyanin